VQSPVTLIVTDPEGRKTGIDTNGVEFQQIPQSWFQPALADEEEEGATSNPPDGAKTVVINNPESGNYQIALVGTGSGAYTLLWDKTDSTGTLIGGTNFTGVVNVGQIISYSTAGASSGPIFVSLQKTNSTVTITWNSTIGQNYQLQYKTNLLQTNWINFGNPINATSLNVGEVDTMTNAQRFYRVEMQ
jgi:hypothetical protein